MSPVLQLAVLELPIATAELTTAGDRRKINAGYRTLTPSFNENVKLSAEQEEPHRRRHHGHQNVPDEQADDASRFTSSFHQHQRKHKNNHLPRPLPTLATLEDHDFMTESDDDFVRKFNEQMLRSSQRSTGRRSTRKVLSHKRKQFNRF